MKVVGKVDIQLNLGHLEFDHQVLVDIVDKAILCVNIMSAYGFIVCVKNNAVRIRHEGVMLCTVNMSETSL